METTPEEMGALTKPSPGGMVVAAIKQLRPKQWAKQVFLLAALVFSRNFFDPDALFAVFVGIMSFNLLSSSGYVLNDFLDREADRKHPTKRFRPIASGALPVPAAVVLMITCLVGGLALGWYLNPWFFSVALLYLATTQSYSFYFKHKVLLDVMFLASGFVWRAIAGALAIGVAVSPWLFLVTAFVSLFLGFNKRRAELLHVGSDGTTRKILQLYTPAMLEQFQVMTAGATVLCYALYTVSGPTPWMTLTIPFVVYGIFRYVYLVERMGEGGAPDETLLRDWPILLTGLLYALTAAVVLLANDAGYLPDLMLTLSGP